MKERYRSRVRLVVSSTVGALLFGGMLWYVGVDKLLVAMGQASPLWLVLCASMAFPTCLIRAWRWKLLLTPLKGDVRVTNTFWSISVGFLVNTVIPIGIGELIRTYILCGKEKLSFAGGFSSIVAERTLDMLGVVTLGVVLLLIQPVGTNVPQWFLDAFKAVVILLAIFLTVIIVGARRETPLIGLLNRILNPISFLSKRRDKILSVTRNLIKGVRAVSQSPELLLKNLIATSAALLLQLLGVLFLFNAFNHPAPLTVIFLGTLITWFTFIIPAPPGYMGTYEAYWVLIFLGLGLTQVNLLLAMGVTLHIIDLIIIIGLGGLGVVWLGLSFGEIFRMRGDKGHER